MYVFDADRERLVRNRLEIMVRVSYFDQLSLETSPYIRLPHSFRLAERDQCIAVAVEYQKGWIVWRDVRDGTGMRIRSGILLKWHPEQLRNGSLRTSSEIRTHGSEIRRAVVGYDRFDAARYLWPTAGALETRFL